MKGDTLSLLILLVSLGIAATLPLSKGDEAKKVVDGKESTVISAVTKASSVPSPISLIERTKRTPYHGPSTQKMKGVTTQAIVAAVILVLALLSIVIVLVVSYTDGKITCCAGSQPVEEAVPMPKGPTGAKLKKPMGDAPMNSAPANPNKSAANGSASAAKSNAKSAVKSSAARGRSAGSVVKSSASQAVGSKMATSSKSRVAGSKASQAKSKTGK